MIIDLFITATEVFEEDNGTIYDFYGEDSSGNIVLLEYITHSEGIIEGQISFVNKSIVPNTNLIFISIDYNEKFMFIHNCKESFKILTQKNV